MITDSIFVQNGIVRTYIPSPIDPAVVFAILVIALGVVIVAMILEPRGWP